MKGQKWLISCIKKYRKNIVISSGIAIFSDVSKRCNILLSQYIAIKNAHPCSGPISNDVHSFGPIEAQWTQYPGYTHAVPLNWKDTMTTFRMWNVLKFYLTFWAWNVLFDLLCLCYESLNFVIGHVTIFLA